MSVSYDVYMERARFCFYALTGAINAANCCLAADDKQGYKLWMKSAQDLHKQHCHFVKAAIGELERELEVRSVYFLQDDTEC